MRDEILDRLWVDHHQGLGDAIDRAVAGIGRRLGRFAEWDGTTHQLIALASSFAITALSFGATT
ncbi:MAG: hypothetical protein ACT4OE_10405 [Sphingosinicella sp.]